MTETGDTAPQTLVIPAHAGIQYAVASRFITEVSDYWIIRFRG
jgi:hypothetical protein